MFRKFYNKNKNNIINQSVISRNGQVSITRNGKTITVQGNNVSISNNKIIIDGKEYKDGFKEEPGCIYNITVEGNVDTVECNGDATIKGSVNCDMIVNGDIELRGDHSGGNISAGGDIEIYGNNTGNVSAGGDVEIRCNNNGNISCGGDVITSR